MSTPAPSPGTPLDLLDPASFDGGQPHAHFDRLRADAPCWRHPEPGGPGFWAITRHADVYRIGRDPAAFSSQPTIMIADPDVEFVIDEHRMMLMMDPPQHTVFRRLISRAFLPGRADGMVPRIRDLARRIVDEVIEAGSCDFVAQVAGEMPSFVIAEMLGLPLEDGRRLYALTETIHTAPEVLPPGAHAQAVGEMFAYASGVFRARRDDPGTDLASQLLQAEVGGAGLDEIDFQLFFMLLVDAGGDTTRNLVGAGLLALLDHPAQFAWLREDLAARLPAAREELLRYTSPVIYMRRTATADTELHGETIRAGDKVVLYYGAANRDPAVFERPQELDLGRDPNPHLAFGGGPHLCLGQHIARVEIDCLLYEVFTRMQDIELADDPAWLPSTFISGPARLPIRFRAAARST